jgi:hypothetical protein
VLLFEIDCLARIKRRQPLRVVTDGTLLRECLDDAQLSQYAVSRGWEGESQGWWRVAREKLSMLAVAVQQHSRSACHTRPGQDMAMLYASKLIMSHCLTGCCVG